jgi:hypothetical protein
MAKYDYFSSHGKVGFQASHDDVRRLTDYQKANGIETIHIAVKKLLMESLQRWENEQAAKADAAKIGRRQFVLNLQTRRLRILSEWDDNADDGKYYHVNEPSGGYYLKEYLLDFDEMRWCFEMRRQHTTYEIFDRFQDREPVSTVITRNAHDINKEYNAYD